MNSKPFINSISLAKTGISAIVWNADHSLVALCPCTNEILIFETDQSTDISKWKIVHVLEEHTQPIAALDWHPKTNDLVSCGYDNNVVVYTYSNKKFHPKLVNIHEQNRAVLCIVWSLDGKKFAMGSANKILYIGYYLGEDKIWTALKIKKNHYSCINAVRFHPSGQIIATGCSDGFIRLISSFVSEVDQSQLQTPFSVSDCGTVLKIINLNSWVFDIEFSPSGDYIAGVSRNCSVLISKLSEAQEPISLTWQDHPFTKIKFINEQKIICGGFDRILVTFLFNFNENKLTLDKKLDNPLINSKSEAEEGKEKSSFSHARSIFEQKKLGEAYAKTKMASGSKSNEDQKKNPNPYTFFCKEVIIKHKNTISSINLFEFQNNSCNIVASSDLSGFVHFWEI